MYDVKDSTSTSPMTAAGSAMTTSTPPSPNTNKPSPINPEPQTNRIPLKGQLTTKTFPYNDTNRRVTIYIPPTTPEATIFAGDGHLTTQWANTLESTPTSTIVSTMIVGVHCHEDETRRLHEYSPDFDEATFTAHEKFFVEGVRSWVYSQFNITFPRERTVVLGVSASGEFAIAMGLRHPEIFGVVFCASPGGGFRPPLERMVGVLPRAYFVAGTEEPFFRDNAVRWADKLREEGADVEIIERRGEHGGSFWWEEVPLMIAWAFGK